MKRASVMRVLSKGALKGNAIYRFFKLDTYIPYIKEKLLILFYVLVFPRVISGEESVEGKAQNKKNI